MSNRLLASIAGWHARGLALIAFVMPLLAPLSVVTADEQSGAAAPQLSAIVPSPVPASPHAQRVVLHGNGFVAGSRAAISRDGKVELLTPERVEVLDSQRLALSIVPGESRSDWAVQISPPDNRHSNVLRFQVVVQAEEKPRAQPEADVVVETPSRTDAGAATGSRPRQSLRGHDWLAAQAKGHFTLQLLASESRERVEWAATQQPGEDELALFAMERDGRTLYALTQGSYATRSAAEQAAATLPAGSSPWIRTMESVQRVMLREQPPATEVKSAGTPLVEDVAWVWSRNPAHYTLQLAASADEYALEASMQRFSLPGTMSILHTRRSGKEWYILIYGSFSDREAAQQAIPHLPAALRQASVWPRRFEELHDLLSGATAR